MDNEDSVSVCGGKFFLFVPCILECFLPPKYVYYPLYFSHYPFNEYVFFISYIILFVEDSHVCHSVTVFYVTVFIWPLRGLSGLSLDLNKVWSIVIF